MCPPLAVEPPGLPPSLNISIVSDYGLNPQGKLGGSPEYAERRGTILILIVEHFPGYEKRGLEKAQVL
jgi:hypothetical protein